MFSIIKPRGDIKTNWESVNPVLRLREWGVEWEETVGTGDIKVKIGDGVKHWNELDYAIVNDVTKKIVKTFAEVNSDDNPNPILNPGESIDALFGKIKQKFEYTTNFMTSLKNMVGDYQARSFNTGSGTVTADDLKSAIDILEQYKLTTANILDVNDSTNTLAALSANQGRLINEKAVANANAISTLNSNLQEIGTVLQSSYVGPNILMTELNHEYDICTITLPKGKWLLIGCTLANGTLTFTYGSLFSGRSTQKNHQSNLAFGLAIVPDGIRSSILRLIVGGESEGYSNSEIHTDSNYCGIKAIKIG